MCREQELAFEKNLIGLLQRPGIPPKTRRRFSMQLARLHEYQAKRRYPDLPVDDSVPGP